MVAPALVLSPSYKAWMLSAISMTLLALSMIVPLKLLLPMIELIRFPAPAEARLTPIA